MLDQEIGANEWYLFPQKVDQIDNEVEQKSCQKWGEGRIEKGEDGCQEKKVEGVEQA